MRKMNDNFIVLLCLLILVVVGGLFVRQSLNENTDDKISNERSQKDKRSLGYNQGKITKEFNNIDLHTVVYKKNWV
jgi:hypothetical protein